MKVVVHFDGACSMKSETAAGGAIVYAEDGTELGRQAKFLRACTTPQAEYTALITGLVLAQRLGATHVKAMGDAELIVYHVDGTYDCKKRSLRVMRDLVRLLAARFEVCEITLFPKAGPNWKRRFGNAAADELAGECLKAEEDVLVLA